MRTVYFDFDNTLTKIDTLLPFAIFLSTKRGRIRGLLPFAISTILLRFGKISNTKLKEDFALWLLKGEGENAIHQFSDEFFERYMNLIIDPEIFTLLRRHLSKKDEVYVVSANFTVFLAPLNKLWLLTDVIGTKAEVRNGRFTGRISGKSCHGQEKLRLLIERFGEDNVRDAKAYGDSRADLFLLNYVKEGVLIQCEEKFIKKIIYHLAFLRDLFQPKKRQIRTEKPNN